MLPPFAWLLRTRLKCLPIYCAIAAIVLTSTSSVAQEAKQSAQNKLPAELEEVLRWLPEDTESLMVASGRYMPAPLPPPGLIVESGEYVDGKFEPIYRDANTGKVITPPRLDSEGDFWRMAIEMSGFSFLDDVDEPHLQKIARLPLRHAALASRRFKPVTGIPGGTPFEGCAVLWFERPIPMDLVAMRSDETTRTERIADQVVASIATREEWGENQKLTLYFAHPKPQVLLMATDKEFLRTMLTRITQRTATRAMPPDRAEWQNLDASARVWGIRRELNGKRESNSVALAPASDGLTYMLTSAPTREIVLRLRSTERAPDVVLNIFFESTGAESDGKPLQATMISKDTAEARLPMESDSLLIVYVFMGHVVYP